MGRGEAQGYVDHGSFVGELLTDFQARGCQRDFDGDVVGDVTQDVSFLAHGFVVGGGDFGADRAGDDVANFLDQGDKLFAGFGDE